MSCMREISIRMLSDCDSMLPGLVTLAVKSTRAGMNCPTSKLKVKISAHSLNEYSYEQSTTYPGGEF